MMYGFNLFAASLNEPEVCVAPTDCRLRPDIRLMEQQEFDKANDDKVHVINLRVNCWVILRDVIRDNYVKSCLPLQRS